MEGETALWQGETKDSFAHGTGLLTWYYFRKVVSTYKGEMRLGRPHGHGVYRFADGDIYEGKWVDGQRHGFGRQWYASGESYIGEWERDRHKAVG